jgi:hypothetical protein
MYGIPASMSTSRADRVQWRLVPMLLVLYLLSFIDRANIGNAKIEGMTESLNLTGAKYNIALAVFFVPYTLLGESSGAANPEQR